MQPYILKAENIIVGQDLEKKEHAALKLKTEKSLKYTKMRIRYRRKDWRLWIWEKRRSFLE